MLPPIVELAKKMQREELMNRPEGWESNEFVFDHNSIPFSDVQEKSQRETFWTDKCDEALRCGKSVVWESF